MQPSDGANTGRGAAVDSTLVREVIVESLTRQQVVRVGVECKRTILFVMILATDGAW